MARPADVARPLLCGRLAPTPIRKDLLPYARDVSGALAEDSRIRQIASIFLQLVGRINGRADDALDSARTSDAESRSFAENQSIATS
jgi:hypothetical protein